MRVFATAAREHRGIGACELDFNRSDIQSVLAQGIVRSSFDQGGCPLPVTYVPGLFCNQCDRSGPKISLDAFVRADCRGARADHESRCSVQGMWAHGLATSFVMLTVGAGGLGAVLGRKLWLR